MDSLIWIASLSAGLLAPIAVLLGWAHRRQYRHAILKWRRTPFVVLTVLFFVLNLTLFVLGAFFLAIYLNKLDGIARPQLAPYTIRDFSLLCFALLGTSIACYLSLQTFFTQYLTEDRIVQDRFDWLRLRTLPQGIDWQAVSDYFVKTDYPFTHYYFLVGERDGSFVRRHVAVPFYALPRFEELLNHKLEQHSSISAAELQRLPDISPN